MAAVLSLVSDAAPTGIRLVDRVWVALFAAATTYLASRASRSALLWMAAVTAVAAVGDWSVAPALVSMVLVVVAITDPTRARLVRATAGATSALALLLLPDLGPHGACSVVALVAVAPLLPSSYYRSPDLVRRRIRRTLVTAVVLLVVAGGIAAAAAAAAGPALVRGGDAAQAGLRSAGEGSQSGAAEDFEDAEGQFVRARNLLDGAWMVPAQVVPVLSQHVRALSTTANAGADLASRARAAVTIAPYEELTSSGGHVDLDRVEAMQAPVRDAADALGDARRDLAKARSPWLLPLADDAITDVVEELDDAAPEVELAADALEVAPGLLGGDGTKRYLVLFTTPAETRFLGGFTGSYAVLEATDGTVDKVASGPIAELDAPPGVTRELTVDEEYRQRYGRWRPELFMQNVTASPDVEDTAEVAASLYEQSTQQALDGVIVADPYALEGLLHLTGPIDVPSVGFPLTAENVVDFLLRDQYALFQDDDLRKERLDDVGGVTFDALTERDLPKPDRLGAVLGPVVDGKHLMFVPFDAEARDFIRAIGALPPFGARDRSDVLSVRMANRGGDKIDAYVHRQVDYDVTYDPSTGEVAGTVRVTVRNDAPASGLPAYVIGGPDDDGFPPGTARSFAAVFTPLNALGATVDGQPVPIESQREDGLNVFTAGLDVPSGGTVVLEVQLSGVIEGMGQTYRLLASNQPLANPDGLSVTVRGVDGGPSVAEGRGVEVDGGVATHRGEWARDHAVRARFG